MKPADRLTFSKDDTRTITSALQRYFKSELDQDLGQLPAEMLLDFLSDQVGPYFYNRGLQDAQAVVSQKAEDIADTLYSLERRPVTKR